MEFGVSMAFLEGNNQTMVSEFVLIGFSKRPDLHTFLCLTFSFVYLTTLLGNAGIIVIVYNNTQFHTPMYFFISNLSFLDLVYSSDIAPKMLAGLLFDQRSISYIGCAIQLFFFCALGSTECILFAAMAYDRYVAICTPLNYNLVMQKKTYLGLLSGTYTAGVLHSIIETCFTFHLSFCASNILYHFACDFPPLLSISCTDTTLNEIVLFILSSFVTIPSIAVILMSYISIFMAIQRITAVEGRQKAFSTCASHITAVTLLYSTVLYVYLSPKSLSSRDNINIATVVYPVVLPMINPIIYSLRNKDIKMAIRAAYYRQCCHIDLR